jgi:hypothetical protein
LDIDRLDFMARDTQSAGVNYGIHDLEWIIRSLRFALLPAPLAGGVPQWIVAIDARKGLSTLVQFLNARANMYQLVYHHKTTRAATLMLHLLFRRASELARNGQLSGPSTSLNLALTTTELLPNQFLDLDDSDIWMSLKQWAKGSADSILRNLSSGTINRDLYKVFSLNKDVFTHLKRVDDEEFGRTLAHRAAARMSCSIDDAQYYYGFDQLEFDVIGRQATRAVDDVWIMQSGALGFEYQTLRRYWEAEIGAPTSYQQFLLIVHRDLVEDLSGIVERLSFPAASADQLKTLPAAPEPYKVLGPLGAEGVWKEVYVGASTQPGADPGAPLVALKRYKQPSAAQGAVRRDVNTINLLVPPHENLAHARLLPISGEDTWILEELWVASLEDFVKKQGKRTDLWEIFDIATQLFAGLLELHRKHLRHTDIKPDNCGILYGGHRELRYVLGDFGCLSSTPTQFPAPDASLLGTLRTRAPEVISQTGISLASDVWAMGATIYSLCTLEYPFMPFDAPHGDRAGRDQRELAIKENLGPQLEDFQRRFHASLPPVLAEILGLCFEPADSRPIAEVLHQQFEQRRKELDQDERRWAWQQAESIHELYQLEQTAGTGASNRDLTSEVRMLTTTLRQYIPPQLCEQLLARVKEEN